MILKSLKAFFMQLELGIADALDEFDKIKTVNTTM